MPLASILHRGRRQPLVMAAYRRIVEQARQPIFFTAWGVPDTLDGRFEVLALHAFLVLNRLKREGRATADFAQDLFDTMFADLDRGLREMGATDLGVGRHVKAMAQGFYGRTVAYEQGLAGAEDDLVQALRRNLYGTAAPEPQQLAAVADYLRRQMAALAEQPTEKLTQGEISFAPAVAP